MKFIPAVLAALAVTGCAHAPQTGARNGASAIPSATYAEPGYAEPCSAFLGDFRAEGFRCGGPPELALTPPPE